MKENGNIASQNSKVKRIAVIGAGPAGMTAAISAAETFAKNDVTADSYDILVLEANSEAGKKLKATGNGKCNFTNYNQDLNFYNSDDNEKVKRILEKYDDESCRLFYDNLGIPCREKNGYCYPYSEDAAEVRDCFARKVNEIAAVKYNTRIKHIVKNNDDSCFKLITSDKREIEADRVIVCCGGLSYQSFGSNGDGFFMARELGLEVEDTYPGLCNLLTKDDIAKALDGVRAQTEISLMCRIDNSSYEYPEEIYRESGEIIFSNSGVSGIPIMNSSRHAIKALNEGDIVFVKVDFVPDFSEDKLKEYIKKHFHNLTDFTEANAFVKKKVSDFFCGLLYKNNLDLSEEILLEKLCELLKNYTFEIYGFGGYDKAQVTQGGVKLSELNENLEAAKTKGLYFAGENVNVDAICGGYNLQWAYSSGYTAGEDAAKSLLQ